MALQVTLSAVRFIRMGACHHSTNVAARQSQTGQLGPWGCPLGQRLAEALGVESRGKGRELTSISYAAAHSVDVAECALSS